MIALVVRPGRYLIAQFAISSRQSSPHDILHPRSHYLVNFRTLSNAFCQEVFRTSSSAAEKHPVGSFRELNTTIMVRSGPTFPDKHVYPCEPLAQASRFPDRTKTCCLQDGYCYHPSVLSRCWYRVVATMVMHPTP